ncbi:MULTISPECIES: CDP-alcohol phosphatidyltransferase family protein [Thermomonospora]|uniref:CDP-alcohol phosphatidyltransferase n=1 Tax=Thermomonospora curvata (strain ATCC 19995 / DSM 43183 / JCM 3096 / KCTC 9072 / NBRC 15933 / NCIMB 10081 / Henssen B9) TaxID=471852 RepID=D1A2B3_THECD|nr:MULTISPECIES: CDP-alcohol phosphatidyltransferase family protein [Thermomonospora]ACY99766.1 CDP-alcohol phosphatidyltransferase [Thermomonospora curvata DSM 43183]PKK12771.1 MAG: CDP-alcohol phosphatidyltransferase family protein [Thermomonospora sp. CIF 1]
MSTFSLDDVRRVCKGRDAWWTVFLVDPIAIRLTRQVANRTSITPNQLTAAAFALGLGAAACFALASPGWLVAGALLYHVGFVVDCMDGKIARLKGTGTVFGGWLDFMLDRVRDTLCAVALTGGQYARTGQAAYLYAGMAILALDMFRYVNGPQIVKVRRSMRAAMNAAMREAAADRPRGRLEAPQAGREREEEPEGELERLTDADLHRAFDAHFPWYQRVRRYLLQRRVRTHLVSGIEFQMAVFIIGPLTGQIIGAVAVAGALLMFFELVIIYKFWLSTRAHTRLLAELRQVRPMAAAGPTRAGQGLAPAAEPD